MEIFKKTSNDDTSVVDTAVLESSSESKYWSLKYPTTVVIVFLTVIVFSVAIIFGNLPTNRLLTYFDARSPKATVSNQDNILPQPKDKLLGGLLSSRFNERSCVSRYESVFYANDLRHKPSSYLISRLRRYEALHKKCGPYTELYNTSVDLIKKSVVGRYNNKKNKNGSKSVCNYVVWISYSGLGNRMLSITSAFLYAVLTNRVLLVDPRVNLPHLFCEPFPEASWWLPSDFPVQKFRIFHQNSKYSYGYMVRKNIIHAETTKQYPSSIYLHLGHEADDHDKSFFCDTDQSFLQNVPWLFLRSNIYFLTAFFWAPSFETELNNRLFPNHTKETVFHFLGRYLFHPTNSVWGLITRYYQAYLAQADEKIGIQIRVFHTEISVKYIVDQILACTTKEHLLPHVKYLNIKDQPMVTSPTSNNNKQKKSVISVLMTCLSRKYFEEIKNMYWEHPSVTGEIISIYQPSNEEYQQTDKKLMHDKKAWAEIYLLSLTDRLVTSAWSTFGYVAQGLGGLKPWVLYKFQNVNRTVHKPSCVRALSMEPCDHYPPLYDVCKKKTGNDTGNIIPPVTHCENFNSRGLKLYDPITIPHNTMHEGD